MYKPLFLLLAMVRKNLRKNRTKALIPKGFYKYFLSASTGTFRPSSFVLL